MAANNKRCDEIAVAALRCMVMGMSTSSAWAIWLNRQMIATSKPLSNPMTMATATTPVSHVRTKLRKLTGSR